MPSHSTDDVLIIGAGVIGLSLAYELAGYGLGVRVVDRTGPGAEASWAGAGILPPAPAEPQSAYEQLLALSNRLHAVWAGELTQQVGIDNGYRRTGGWYLETALDEAPSPVGGASLAEGPPPSPRLTTGQVAELEPGLAGGWIESDEFRGAHLVPEEAQIRNPWHLRALAAGASARGARLVAPCEVTGLEVSGGRVRGLITTTGRLAAERYCFTSGAWTAEVLRAAGITIPLRPIRGQIVLVHGPPGRLARIVNVGRRYLVPRDDGRVLIGSTEEDVGFDRRNTPQGVAELHEFGCRVAPVLRGLAVERTWAGLRPATADGFPCLGPLPGTDNAWVAAGHYRAGLQLSPATAVVLGQLVRGQPAEIPLDEFRVDRWSGGSG